MTDAMRFVVDAKNGYIADFKSEVSLRSELGRERQVWEAKYAARMTDQMVPEPDLARNKHACSLPSHRIRRIDMDRVV